MSRPHSSILSVAWAAALVALAAGCLSRTSSYEIDLTPQGDRIERKLTVWSSYAGIEEPSEPEIAHLAVLYAGTFQPDHEKKRGFAGLFGQRMPEDVGGRGTYVRFTNRMGSTSVYVERFGGDDDGAAQIARRQKAAAAMARLFRGWCEQEFGEEPGFGTLRDFIEKNLAHDLLSLSVLVSPVGTELTNAEGRNTAEEWLVRIGQYLLERDYFTVADVPGIMGGLYQDESGTAWLAAIIRRQLGVPPKHPSLAVLGDDERLAASWDKYLVTTPEYRKLADEFKTKPGDPNATSPKPEAVLDDVFDTLIGGPAGPAAELIVRLHIKSEPYETNGVWDETTQAVLWEKSRMVTQPPKVHYAFWSDCDRVYQADHFGRVVLEGQELSGYCLWHHGLTAAEAAEWDGLVDALKPAEDLDERLREFRFSSGMDAHGAKLLQGLLSKRGEPPAQPSAGMQAPENTNR